MLNITNHQGNANKNHNEIPLCTSQNSSKKPDNNKCWKEHGEIWNPHTLLWISTTYKNINAECIKDPSVRAKSLKKP